MNVKRFISAGLAAALLFLVLDALFGVLGGLIGRGVFGVEVTPMDQSKMLAGALFELVNGFLLTLVYAIIYPILPGGGWRKGITYGLIVWGLRVVMWAFSTYMMTDMSPVLIAITVLTGLLEMLIICTAIAVIYRESQR